MKALKNTLQLEGCPESLMHFLDRFDKEKRIIIQSGPPSPKDLIPSLLTCHDNGNKRKTVKFVLKPGPCTAYQKENQEVEVSIKSMESGWNGYHEVWLIIFVIPAHYVNYDHETCPVHGSLLLKAYYDFEYSTDPEIESGAIVVHLEEEMYVEEKRKTDLATIKKELGKTLELLKDVK